MTFYKKIVGGGFVAAAIVAGVVMVPQTARADGAQVSGFTATPSAISHNYMTLLSWTIPNGYGQSLTVTCPMGVTLKDGNGNVFPCNTETAIGTISSSGSFVLAISNVSGYTKTVSMHLTPKDSDGANYSAGAADTSVTVSAAAQPILSFTMSTSSVVSGDSLTFLWTSADVSGVMLRFGCVSGIRVTSSSPSVDGVLPCGSPAYATDLPVSGSATVTLTSDLSYSMPLTVTVLPAIVAGTYDATHAQSLQIPVGPVPVAPPPSAGSFQMSAARIESGNTIHFSWTTLRAAGANIQFSCREGITMFAFVSGATTTLPCNTPAFLPALATSGSTTVTFINTSGNWQTVTATLLPQNSDTTYNGIGAPAVTLTVTPPGGLLATGATPVVGVTPNTNASLPAQTPNVSGKIQATRTLTFSLFLAKNSQNAQVTALQKFLSLDKTLYPEMKVTGFFGPATELAVGRFQTRYGIAKKGDAGYGQVGPKTRAKLNSLEYF